MAITLLLAAKLFLLGFVLWLGSYLLALRSNKGVVRLTGWGLIAYALTLSFEILSGTLIPLILLLPALLWVGASLHLWPETTPWREGLIRAWVLSIVPLLILTLLNPWFAAIVVLALFACAGMLVKLALESQFKNTLAVIAVVALFFGLSTGLMVLPVTWIGSMWGISLLGIDLLLLGLAITVWDAFDEGERMHAHLLRSFVSAIYYAGALAALVIIGIILDGKMTFGKQFLLLAVTVFGILAQVFSNSIQEILDRLTFSRSSDLSAQRQVLRASTEHLARLSDINLAGLDEEAFTRLTRRAISSLGDLPKLSASPLTNLSIVTSQSGPNPLERAHALKALLIESIRRLKPRRQAKFGVTDEWRYYNVLYYPYVMGLKPYSRRLDREFLDKDSLQALDWFQSTVPERTLYNWQNTAAGLVARDLMDQEFK